VMSPPWERADVAGDGEAEAGAAFILVAGPSFEPQERA